MIPQRFKPVVAAGFLALALAGPGLADDRLDDLFTALREADAETGAAIEGRIWEEWSHSGSPAMDLLLERGRAAMAEGDFMLAIEHFTALVDHAPEFPEGYNARATAYFRAGLYGPSLADIRTTLALNPRHFGALAGLAAIFEELGEKKGALAAYREVEKLFPAREGLRETIDRLSRQVEGENI